jgi:hypothetical protein
MRLRRVFLLVSGALVTLSLLFSFFYWGGRNELLILGWLSIAIFLQLEAFSSTPFFKDNNPDPETGWLGPERRVMARRIIRLVFCQLLFLFATGWLFRILHFPGANEMLILGLGPLAVGYLIRGFFQKGLTILMTILLGLSTACSLIAILFNWLHFPGAREMIWNGILPAALWLSVYFAIKNRLDRMINQRFVYVSIVSLFMCILIIHRPVWIGFTNLNINSQFVEEAANEQILLDKLDNIYNFIRQDKPEATSQAVYSIEEDVLMIDITSGRYNVSIQTIAELTLQRSDPRLTQAVLLLVESADITRDPKLALLARQLSERLPHVQPDTTGAQPPAH